MRSNPARFAVHSARSLDEALAAIAGEPGAWRPFAGGTDLMVQLAAGTLGHRRFVSLWGIRTLRRIDESEAAVRIGALTTYADVLRSALLRREFPSLARAAAETGGIANQNRGTLGGNIANASPAADTPPALLVHDADLELASARGTRLVPYDRFHRGYKQMDLAPDEIITAIILPRRPGWSHYYRKVGARRAQAIAKVGLAGAIQLGDGGRICAVRVALASVAPAVLRARRTEAILQGEMLSAALIGAAADTLASELSPIDDIRSTQRYRSVVARNLLEEFLRGAAP